MTPQETDSDLPMSRSLRRRRESARACCRVAAVTAAVCAWDARKEVTITFITSSRVWPQVKQQGGNTAPPINRKLD